MEPKEFLSIKPMPSPSHVGFKITARSSKPNYTCEYPHRSNVAKENYQRRKYQVDNCGFGSANTKPYKEVGNVVLNSKTLILKTLGQAEKEDQIEILSSDDENASDILQATEERELAAALLPQERKLEDELHTIQYQLKKGLDTLNKVKLGSSIFHVIDQEKKKKVHLLEEEKKIEKSKTMWKTKHANEEDETDSEQEDERDIRKYVVPTFETHITEVDERSVDSMNGSLACSNDDLTSIPLCNSPSPAQKSVYKKKTTLQYSPKVRAASTSILCAPINNSKMFKRKNMPRPYSPIYTNVNFYKASSSKALFRQLCVINWILEAMSQDNNPPVMNMISSCWKVSLLNEDPKLLQKRIEREKISDPIWQAFMNNPSRFQQKSYRFKLPARKVSTRRTSMMNYSVASSRDDYRSSCSGHQNLDTSTTKKNFFDVLANEDNKSTQPLNEQTKEQDPSTVAFEKHIQWKKIRDSYNFKATLPEVVLMKIKRGRTMEELSLITDEAKEKFADVRTEQAVILHDNLEQLEKHRCQSYEKKFFALNVMRDVYETLHHLRANGKIIEEEKIETKLICKWYMKLYDSLPENLKEEKNINLILKKIQRFSHIEGRKISSSHFLRALSILRPFELCYPDISAGIEFVRDKIVEMDKAEFETWCKKHIKVQQRSKSAPPAMNM